MAIELLDALILIISGFGAGLFVSICSGTAAGYMIPILTVFLGKTIHKSIGTSLFIDCVVALSAGIIFLKNKKVKLKPMLLVIIFSSIGAVIGSNFTSSVPSTGLSIYIGIVLLVFGFSFIIYGVHKNIEYIKSKYSFNIFKKYKTIIFALAGFSIGLSSGFTGFGGAALIAFGLIFVLEYDLHTAIGTSLVVMFFLAGFGSIGHILKNNFLYESAMYAAPFAIIGALTGSLVANKIDEEKLGKVIGIIFIFLGIAILANLLNQVL